jgi:Fe-S cluster biogenesis protein NfuA/nitrite reductase/ring-hydroxylating ferredoxin subunit
MAGEELIGRIHALTAELERLGDPHARRVAEDFGAAVLEMHGEAIERILGALDEGARRRLAGDPLVGSLLLIHDLHPVPLEDRVQAGLDQVRPYMESHGGNVELLGVEDGVARLRLQGSCNGCGASASTLELAVEKALEETAPDLLGMEVEGAVTAPEVTGTSLPMVSEWIPLEGLDDVSPGELRTAEVDGRRLVVANVEGELLAYLDACTACGSELDGAALSEGVLTCPGCGRGFFLPRAGRSLDDERLQLDPVPLLRDRGAGARVALPA